MSHHERRPRSASRRLPALALALSILLALKVDGATPQEQRALLEKTVQNVATAQYDRNTQAYLERALELLEPFAAKSQDFTPEAIATLRQDLGTAFFDVSRIHQEQAMEHMLRLEERVSTGWKSRRLTDVRALDGLYGLLMAMRQAADISLQDAHAALNPQASPGTPRPKGPDSRQRDAAANLLRQADHAYQQARHQLGNGNPEAAGQHLLLTWQRATRALSALGIAWGPGQLSDVDGDEIPDSLELRVGSSPLSPDTDGDGLRDAFEVGECTPYCLASNRDTDGNSIPDGDEDLDSDGLNNLAEQRAGSDPLLADSDGDGLDDAQELGLGTHPRKPDTDEDGLRDDAEPRMGTNPRDPDTDDDGTLDGRDELTGTLRTKAAVVTVTGIGDVTRTLEVRAYSDVPRYQDLPGLAGTVTELTLAQPFTRARIALPVDLARVPGGDTANLRVMYFDSDAQRWKPVEGAQGFDASTGMAWADTTHLTAFAVFYIPSWNEFWSVERCTDPGTGTGGSPIKAIDVALVLDSSGSMQTNDPGDLRKEGARRLVQGLLEQDRAAVVDFDYSALLLQGLTSDKVALVNALQRIDSSGGTDIGAGVTLGLTELERGEAGRGRIMVLLTDGMGAYSHTLTDRAIASQVAIYTIGLGRDVDVRLLREIAQRTGGKFFPVQTAAELPATFERIQDEAGIADSDGDGLTNCEEMQGMPDSNGKLWFSDPHNPDSDGDGLQDGEEMGLQVEATTRAPPTRLHPLALPAQKALQDALDAADEARRTKQGFDEDPQALRAHLRQLEKERALAFGGGLVQPLQRMIADGDGGSGSGRRFRVGSAPLQFDTDGDGLDDWAERVHGTSPFLADADRDGLNDYDEVVHVTDPFVRDTDADGADDAYEVAHPEGGFDPLVEDEPMEPKAWARDFGRGALLGDACFGNGWLLGCRESIAFFLGQITGGSLSAIPFPVTWVAGTCADVRDFIANLVKLEWAAAGLSLVGLVPDVGDIVKLAGRIAAFVKRAGKLEQLLRVVLRILPKLVGTASRMATASSPPSPQWPAERRFSRYDSEALYRAVKALGDIARKLISEVIQRVNPKGLDELKDALKLESGTAETQRFLEATAALGISWEALSKVLLRMEQNDLFTRYPKMQDFLTEMINSSDGAVLTAQQKLVLNQRVTLNLKRAAHWMSKGNIDKYVQAAQQSLKGALGEHVLRNTQKTIQFQDIIIDVAHVNANGPDLMAELVGSPGLKRFDVFDAKASPLVGYEDLSVWLPRVKGAGGKYVYQFNGERLAKYLEKNNHKLSEVLGEGKELRFHIFIYDPRASLSSELEELFTKTRLVDIKGYPGKVKLEVTRHTNMLTRRFPLRGGLRDDTASASTGGWSPSALPGAWGFVPGGGERCRAHAWPCGPR